jgi:hypothetical protein
MEKVAEADSAALVDGLKDALEAACEADTELNTMVKNAVTKAEALLSQPHPGDELLAKLERQSEGIERLEASCSELQFGLKQTLGQLEQSHAEAKRYRELLVDIHTMIDGPGMLAPMAALIKQTLNPPQKGEGEIGTNDKPLCERCGMCEPEYCDRAYGAGQEAEAEKCVGYVAPKEWGK